MVGCQTCDQYVVGSNPSLPAVECNPGQVVNTHVPLSPSSIIWYQPIGGDNNGLVTDRRLRLFGHTAHSSPQEDHHRAVAAVIRGLPPDCNRPSGRPSHTWLRAMEADLGQQNTGLASAWRKAAVHDDWRHIADTATLQRIML